ATWDESLFSRYFTQKGVGVMTETQKESPSKRASSADPPRILVGFDLYGETDEPITQALSFAVMVRGTRVDIAWMPPMAKLPLQAEFVSPLPDPKDLLRERVQKVIAEFDSENLARAGT